MVSLSGEALSSWGGVRLWAVMVFFGAIALGGGNAFQMHWWLWYCRRRRIPSLLWVSIIIGMWQCVLGVAVMVLSCMLFCFLVGAGIERYFLTSLLQGMALYLSFMHRFCLQ